MIQTGVGKTCFSCAYNYEDMQSAGVITQQRWDQVTSKSQVSLLKSQVKTEKYKVQVTARSSQALHQIQFFEILNLLPFIQAPYFTN